jgi:NADPH:quinone reductase-like Zn-dependent oxidoreductase
MTIPETMNAVLLTGHGGFDRLEFRTDVPVPRPGHGEVLIEVAAAGVNNTDINTRIGWYSKSVSSATDEGGTGGYDEVDADDAGWAGTPLQFPRIQGADCCGWIVAVGPGVNTVRIGQRVLVRTMQEALGQPAAFHTITFGSEVDGAFAHFTVARSSETYAVDASWTDVELASIPCAYSTAENMLHRVELGAERVLITGASGGVGSAAVQLAKRRGAEIIAVAGRAKSDSVRALGAHRVIDRNADPVAELGAESVDVVVDLVAGERWDALPDILRRGGRYVTAGAIAGPLVELDVRTLYLKDLTLTGCTYQDPVAFTNLIAYIEAGEIRPLVAKTYPLADIVTAQKDFLAKQFTGKLVLVP